MAGVSVHVTRVIDGEDVARQVASHMTALGRAIGSRAQRLVPKRTWALHDSIFADEATVQGPVVSVSVGFGKGYGLFVERGTGRMRAQPFLRPAMLQATAADLNYAGGGVTTHGVQASGSRRTRVGNRGL